MDEQSGLPYTLYKRGEIWHARFSFLDNGERVQFRKTTCCTSREEAERCCIKIIASFKRNENGLREITLDEAMGRFMQEVGDYHKYPEKTENHLKQLLNHFKGGTVISKITKDDIQNFVNKKRCRGIKPGSINRDISTLGAVLSRARDFWGYATPNFKISQFKLREPKEHVKYLRDWDEAMKIINNASAHLKPIIYTALYTGLRLGNILGLKWDNVDLDHMTITLKVKDATSDGGKGHSIPIVTPLAAILKDIPRVSAYVFTYKGKPIQSIKTAWRHCFTKDMRYVNFHTLRHTAATWILKATNNLRITKDILGHADISTTLKYAHVLDDEKRDALNTTFAHNLHTPHNKS